MRILTLALLAMVVAGCGDCFVDCAVGYEVVPNTCTCRPVPDAGVADASVAKGAPLASCVPASGCAAGSTCIEGCPASRMSTPAPAVGVCSVPGRDACGCGAVADPCDTSGTVCLMPACCDYPGICVTPEERGAICARPESAHFDCPTSDAGI